MEGEPGSDTTLDSWSWWGLAVSTIRFPCLFVSCFLLSFPSFFSVFFFVLWEVEGSYYYFLFPPLFFFLFLNFLLLLDLKGPKFNKQRLVYYLLSLTPLTSFHHPLFASGFFIIEPPFFITLSPCVFPFLFTLFPLHLWKQTRKPEVVLLKNRYALPGILGMFVYSVLLSSSCRISYRFDCDDGF